MKRAPLPAQVAELVYNESVTFRFQYQKSRRRTIRYIDPDDDHGVEREGRVLFPDMVFASAYYRGGLDVTCAALVRPRSRPVTGLTSFLSTLLTPLDEGANVLDVDGSICWGSAETLVFSEKIDAASAYWMTTFESTPAQLRTDLKNVRSRKNAHWLAPLSWMSLIDGMVRA